MDKDTLISSDKVKTGLEELKERVIRRSNSGKYRKELTEKQKEYYLENAELLYVDQFETIKEDEL